MRASVNLTSPRKSGVSATSASTSLAEREGAPVPAAAEPQVVDAHARRRQQADADLAVGAGLRARGARKGAVDRVALGLPVDEGRRDDRGREEEDQNGPRERSGCHAIVSAYRLGPALGSAIHPSRWPTPVTARRSCPGS